MLNILLMPYSSNECPRWEITGKDVAVSDQVATPLALFVHEIGTNSVKYGALSAPGGHVAISVEACSGATGEHIRLCWRELGGPPVVAPKRRGFGYRLAELSIVSQLGGALEFDWLPEGLVITAMVPAAPVGVVPMVKSARPALPLASRPASFCVFTAVAME